ncbi:MAG: lysylphosphatidylglycerol synthase transmembrane domain-containing protein [Kiritimatiellia bacterium]|nr:lysylphosphatidylglycerol synthase transmembrane domain-containing protein [Kiritimatiellia bacterium]
MSIRVKQLLKVVLSLALLAYLIRLIDWRSSLQLALRANPLMMIIAIALLTLERVLSVLKWRLFLTVRGSKITFWRLFIINYVGGFWGLILPSSVSADIVRGFYLSKATSDLNLTVTSMAADRFISGVSLVCIACLGGWYAGYQPGLQYLHILILVIAILTFSAVVLLFQHGFLRWLDGRIIQKFIDWKIVKVARKWLVSCLEYRKYPGLLTLAFLLSLSVQVVRVLVFYVVALGFDLHAPLIYYVVFIPLIMVLIMLPVSINGIGVREVSFVGFFSLAGMPESGAFAISFAVSVLTTLTTAVGGIIYMFDKGPSLPEHTETFLS